MSKGTIPEGRSFEGVEVPTHAASHQWVLGRFRWVRLNLVSPPEPHSTGSPSVLSRSKRAQRVALTVVASLNGALTWVRIAASTPGLSFRNSWRSCAPLAVLHGWHAKVRLL